MSKMINEPSEVRRVVSGEEKAANLSKSIYDDIDTIGIQKLVMSDEQLSKMWERLPEERREYFKLVDEKRLVPNILSDVVFKSVFNPNINPDRISKLISSILGRKIRVVRSLDKEGIYLSQNSKGVILDLLVEFDDGSVADVEVQRNGIKIPPQRAATYSANLLTRQYAIERGEGEKKKDVDFSSLRPVYTIVIMEKTPEPFNHSPECVHHFQQKSDTGVEKGHNFELLQYYDFIALDIFHRERPHVASVLETWLDFLSIRYTDEMESFLVKNPEFRGMYDQAVRMMAGREELLSMFQDIFAEEDIAYTIYSAMNHEMSDELAEEKRQNQALRELVNELRENNKELEETIKKLTKA